MTSSKQFPAFRRIVLSSSAGPQNDFYCVSLKMEPPHSFEESVPSNRQIQEDVNLQHHCCENLKYRKQFPDQRCHVWNDDLAEPNR
jgi:hypothetical protein